MIIFCDFDGTLWRHSDENLVELRQNIVAIQNWRHKSSNNYFVIASGRSLPSLRRRCPKFTDFSDFFISDNGGYVFDNRQQSIIKNTLPADLATQVIEIVNRSLEPDQFRVSYYTETDEVQDLPGEIGKIRLWFRDPESIDVVTNCLNAAFPGQLKIHAERHHVKSMLSWIDASYTSFVNVVSAAAGKESAIQQLLDQLHLAATDATSIGDDLNDAEMLRAYNGHILADAHPLLRAEFPPDRQHRTVAEFINSL